MSHISETRFFQIWDLFTNIVYNMNFHHRTHFVKINDQSFQYIKKTLFLFSLGSFSQFLEQKKISKKITLPCTSPHGFLATCQNTEKNWRFNSKKMSRLAERRKVRWKAKQTLCHRTLLVANTESPTKCIHGELLNLYSTKKFYWETIN